MQAVEKDSFYVQLAFDCGLIPRVYKALSRWYYDEYYLLHSSQDQIWIVQARNHSFNRNTEVKEAESLV